MLINVLFVYRPTQDCSCCFIVLYILKGNNVVYTCEIKYDYNVNKKIILHIII